MGGSLAWSGVAHGRGLSTCGKRIATDGSAFTCVANAPPCGGARRSRGRLIEQIHQPAPRFCLLAVGEGRLTPEIGPKFQWPLQTQKGGLTHDLVRHVAKLGTRFPCLRNSARSLAVTLSRSDGRPVRPAHQAIPWLPSGPACSGLR